MASGSTMSGGGSNSKNEQSSTNTISSIAGWVKSINPNYSKFIPNSTSNCGSCAFAVEKRLNGESSAQASIIDSEIAPLKTDGGMETATGKKCVYMPVTQIEEKLRSMGTGSHLIVGINRTGGRVGHWFNVFYDGKKIYTIDGQSGSIFGFPHDYGHISEWCAMI